MRNAAWDKDGIAHAAIQRDGDMAQIAWLIGAHIQQHIKYRAAHAADEFLFFGRRDLKMHPAQSVLQRVLRKARLNGGEVYARRGKAFPAPASHEGTAFITRWAGFNADDARDGGGVENHNAQTSAALS